MNHQYLYPDEAPWTPDYQELRDLWRFNNHLSTDSNNDDTQEHD